MNAWIKGSENRIEISGGLGLGNFRRVLAALHNLTTERRYRDIVLDFEKCSAAYAGPMIYICMVVGDLRRDGIGVELRLPEDQKLGNLFRNTNWAWLIDPENFQEEPDRWTTHLPAMQFSSPSEQHAAINKTMERIFGNLRNLERGDFAAIEWTIGEVTDNVLTHAQSEGGGILQMSDLRDRIEFAVGDTGKGIPETLRESHPEISDPDALARAIQKNVTRDRNGGQGNGLFGTFKVTQIGKGGYLHIHSGHASLRSEDERFDAPREETIPCPGTLVVVCISKSKSGALAEALGFEKRIHPPFDYIEAQYETGGDITFAMHQETSSFMSRIAGQSVRTKLENLIRMSPSTRIVVDLSQVPLCSSSFADEVFGKLFLQLGALEFMRRFEFRGVSNDVRMLMDQAIVQRSATEP